MWTAVNLSLVAAKESGVKPRHMLMPILTALLTALVVASPARPASAVVLKPVADGSVTDVNGDGRGDWILDGDNSVLVGFDAFGPGEHRGVYVFGLQTLSHCVITHATLRLNVIGSRFAGTDPNLTLYAAIGNQVLDLHDYAAEHFPRAFTTDVSPAPVDAQIDVTPVVRLASSGVITFTIRPNPHARATAGALLFSSNETSQISDQFAPAELRVDVGSC